MEPVKPKTLARIPVHTKPTQNVHISYTVSDDTASASSSDSDRSSSSGDQKFAHKTTYMDDSAVHYTDDTETEPEDDTTYDTSKKVGRVDISPGSTIDADEDDDETTSLTSSPNALNYCVTIVSRSRDNSEALCPVWDADAIQEKARLTEKFSMMPGVFDEDDEDTFDIAMAAEYSNDIFEYMRELEFKYRPDMDYMELQPELNWHKRGILIDWLVRIHDHCGLLPETLFLTVHFTDRFLSLKPVGPAKLQLVCVVALFVAAKYEEITCPSVQEIAYMVDNEYSVDEILRAERFFINLLQFNLGWPGPMSFLRRSSKADDYDSDTRTLAKYLLETTIMEPRFVAAPPSWLAAASHFLSRKILARGPWTDAHAYFSGYTEAQLLPAVNVLMAGCQVAKEHHRSVFLKYSTDRFKRASEYVENWMAQL